MANARWAPSSGADRTSAARPAPWRWAYRRAIMPPMEWPITTTGTPGRAVATPAPARVRVVDDGLEAGDADACAAGAAVPGVIGPDDRGTMRPQPIGHVAVPPDVLAVAVRQHRHVAGRGMIPPPGRHPPPRARERLFRPVGHGPPPAAMPVRALPG